MKRWRTDRGSIAVSLVLLLVLVLAGGGLILDGGRAMVARRHATNIAEGAARVAVSTATPTQPFDETQARGLAVDFAGRAGIPPQDVAVIVTSDVVTVTITERRRAVFLAFGGLPSMTVHATGRARVVFSG
jgi:Flp pilus assembly protein TadG